MKYVLILVLSILLPMDLVSFFLMSLLILSVIVFLDAIKNLLE